VGGIPQACLLQARPPVLFAGCYVCVISASLVGEPQVQIHVRWLLSVARGFSDGHPWVHAEAGAQRMGWKLAVHRQMRPMGLPAFYVCRDPISRPDEPTIVDPPPQLFSWGVRNPTTCMHG
jgi:hypothetical protein